MNYNLWVWFGTLYLLRLTWQDFKSMKVDDRYNWFMMGLSISMVSVYQHKWYYIIALAIFLVLVIILLNTIKVFGAGDTSAITWLVMGFGIINVWLLAWFVAVFIIISLVYGALKKTLIKTNKPLPFFPVILISFILFTIIWGLW
jgi:hypothetical protein